LTIVTILGEKFKLRSYSLCSWSTFPRIHPSSDKILSSVSVFQTH
jgi:hypothetical protein